MGCESPGSVPSVHNSFYFRISSIKPVNKGFDLSRSVKIKCEKPLSPDVPQARIRKYLALRVHGGVIHVCFYQNVGRSLSQKNRQNMPKRKYPRPQLSCVPGSMHLDAPSAPKVLFDDLTQKTENRLATPGRLRRQKLQRLMSLPWFQHPI